ncbi:hypothetical protein [Herbaspirillum sp. VT-16-41]|uniref:hypothetical protein n=1 Tax=Herbaspirillum sp. VT-16-41 TaxID=1953765 RepID=UPI0009817678|nr:hypothetical protein [Herbaspirillum sp. VT-16-41]ONN64866.1 hypothetical protein BTM36_19750 [Herbaspirillum sp. VT-16-41]
MNMKIIVGLILCLLAPVAAHSNSKDLLILLDSLCIGTGANINTIEKMVLAQGGKVLPKSFVDADPVGAKMGGKAFSIKMNGEKYFLMAVERGGCSILSQTTSTKEFESALTKTYQLVKIGVDSSGPQVVTNWEMIGPSRTRTGVLTLNIVKPGFGADGALSVGFVPPSALK